MKIPPDCRTIMDRLAEAGAKVYLAGGCVRDSLRGVAPKDFDITTDFEPERILDLFPKGHYHGKSFGVVTVGPYEIATFRQFRSAKWAGYEGELSFADDVTSDLKRRDFTVNAMAVDRTGAFIDPFGGRKDLEAGRVRFVGDPVQRIRDDQVRTLRGCRFAGLLDGVFDDTTWKAICEYSPTIQLVARERIRAELLKIMEVPNLVLAMESLRKSGLLPFILYPLQACVGVDQNRYHTDTVYMHSLLSAQAAPPRMPLLRLAMLLHDVGKPPARFVKEDGQLAFYGHDKMGARIIRETLPPLKFSNAEVDYVAEVARRHMFDLDGKASKRGVRRFLAKLRHVPVNDILVARISDFRGNHAITGNRAAAFVRSIRRVQNERPPLGIKDLAVGGKDLIEELGMKGGPEMGRVLNALFDKVLEDPGRNDRETLLAMAREMAGG